MAAGDQALPNVTEKASRPDFEERRLALDEEMRRREMTIRELEAKRGAKLSPSKVSLIGAILTLLGGVIGAGITAWSTRDIEGQKSLTSLQIEEMKVKGELDLEGSRQQASENLERKKFETTLILEAIKTTSRSEAIRNLKFFVNAGFVSDPDGKIAALSEEDYPSLTEPSKESSARALQSTGLVTAKFSSMTFVCTGTLVAPRYVITADLCIDPGSHGGGSTEGQSDPELVFTIKAVTTPLTIAKRLPEANVALLQLSVAAPADLPIQRWNVREPVEGENVYLAFRVAGADAVQLRTCKVVGVEESDFQYSCETGGGSAGALVIAVSDDALLGIHHSANVAEGPPVGIGAKMSRALATLEPVIAGTSQ